jgi:CRP-like cAMP-binding protein
MAQPVDTSKLGSLFEGFDDAMLSELMSACQTITLPGGHQVFRQGEMGSAAYFVRRGAVEVIATRDGGGEHPLARLGEGSFFGEVAFLAPGVRTATVRTLGASELLVLDRPTFESAVLTGNAGALRLSHTMAMLLAQRLRSTSNLLQDVLREEDGVTSDTQTDWTGLDASIGMPVRVTRDLQLADLVDLVEGRILAVRVPSYYTPRQSDQLYRKLLRHPGFSRYLMAPDVGVQRIGMTFFETQERPEMLQTYFDEARATAHSIRQVCAPLLTPVDRLRLELDEVWPSGACIGHLEGRKMLAGIARLFEDSHSLPPHQDVLHRDTSKPDAQQIKAQLTANIYLHLGRSGGELELWDWMPTDEEARGLLTGEYDFYDRAKLPPPSCAIRPLKGELVLTLSTRIHAVRPSEGGPRVSMSTFIGYTGPDQPLTLWN